MLEQAQMQAEISEKRLHNITEDKLALQTEVMIESASKAAALLCCYYIFHSRSQYFIAPIPMSGQKMQF